MPIEPPTDEEREQLRAELLADADLVRDYGWDEGWSAGQIAGVRAVLGEPGTLDEAVPLWAATLWGVAAAEADAAAGYPRTRKWLLDAADEYRRPIPWPPCPRPGWRELYEQMIAELTALDPDVTPQRDGVAVVEGELAVMVRSRAPHFDVWRILCRATAASTVTCQVCGQPGAWQEEIDGNPVLCAEHTPEIRTGPVATVGELVERLRHLPASTPLLTDGYEGGLTTISAVAIIEVQELDRDEDQAMYQGEYETVAEAQRQAALSPDDPEIAVGGIAPPRLVGDPVYAVILRRKGR